MQAAADSLPDEAAARRLVLARALDESDPQGRLVGATEKQQADEEALHAVAPDATAPDPLAWLQARAARLVALLHHRSPTVAALAGPPAWQRHAAWALPLLATVAGGLIDRIDNPRQVNLLSPPLLAFLLWNLAMYVLLIVHAVRPRAPAVPVPPAIRWPWRRAGGVRAEVAAAFHRHWWKLAGGLEANRAKRILHASAAAWGFGVAVSIVLGGLVREYRVGWESTLLDPPQVHAVLHAMFAPVAAVFGIEPFSMAEVQRLHFGSGADVTRVEARRWVALYLGLLGLVVIGPRLVLALWAAGRERIAARSLRVDLDEPYFAGLLSRVTPARVRLAITGDDAGAFERLHLILRQAGGLAATGEPPWTLLTTARGDALQVVEPPLPHRTGPPPASAWRLPWARPEDGARRPGVDLQLVLAADGGQGAGAPPDALPGVPALVIGGRSLAWRDLPTWREDVRLWAALVATSPPHLRAGLERLASRAREHAQDRLHMAMHLLATDLLATARDAQAVPAAPIGMRQLLLREERDAAELAREQATGSLLGRLQQRQDQAVERLLALHGLSSTALQPHDGAAAGVRLQRAVHAPQAGIAGAASGAAVGATVDLVTGGLTLGAASALGALVGGGAAMVAAAWRNARGDASGGSVAIGDEALPDLVRGALLRYLAVIHAGRAQSAAAEAWATAVRGRIQPADDTVRLLRESRIAADADHEAAALEHALAAAVQDILRELHGDAESA